MNKSLFALLLPLAAQAQDEFDPPSTAVKVEVREAAMFKDGHAFILAEGMIPPKTGWYVTHEVPEAILGTLWTFTGNPKARVEAVRSGFEVIEKKGPCLTLIDTIESAQGLEVVLALNDAGPQPRLLEGVIADLPKIAPERPEADAAPDFVRGETVHVRTPLGIEVVRKSSIVSIRLKKENPLEKTTRTVRRRILVKVAVDADIAAEPIPLRFVYVQKGLRWIPEYRVELLANKKMKISLQGTVVNELADLRDVHASLVVGIPNFMMKDSLSPMALRQAVTGLSQYFHADNRMGNIASNAVMSQVARYTEVRGAPEAAGDASMEMLAKGSAADEYFLYSRPGVTLRRGERASYPIFEGTFDYQDAYTLKIGATPPRFIMGDRMEELRQSLLSPKVMHALRIRNTGKVPWTTGPAMIVRDGRALSQDMMRFTPSGGEAHLPMAEMADVAVRVHDVELNRTNNVRIDGYDHTQVFMKGTICLVNHRKEPLPVEIDRAFFGKVDKIGAGGTSEAFDFAGLPWDRYSGGSWPNWWLAVNGMFQGSWKATLEAGKSTDFTCEWSYFRR
jgi:hypothetical protein